MVADLAPLRGEHRATHLEHLICTLARTWTAYYQPDISFGYKIYDSSSGEMLLNHQLQRVASALSE